MYSLSEIEHFIFQHRPEGLIVDTKILILLFVGIYSPDFIKECKLTSDKYTQDDFELLKKIISFFQKVIITPHVVAEISNLSIRDVKGNEKLLAYFGGVIKFFKSASTEERHLELGRLVNIDIHLITQFGFTDMAMFELSRSKGTKMPILTDDLRLAVFAGTRIPIIKFEYIRSSSLSASLAQ